MFKSDYRYFGIHSSMTDDLLIKNGGIFDTVYDLFISAAIVGFAHDETSVIAGDRNETTTIFSDKLIKEIYKTEFIVRTLIISNENLDDLDKNTRIDRALRYFSVEEVSKVNQKYIEGYALRGIEILHEQFILNKGKQDLVDFVDSLLEKYTTQDNDFESIHSQILELSRN
jgi:hypothetical protein